MLTYDEIAALLESLAEQHDLVAGLLVARDDAKHKEENSALAEAQKNYADSCRLAAAALRERSLGEES